MKFHFINLFWDELRDCELNAHTGYILPKHAFTKVEHSGRKSKVRFIFRKYR